MSFKKIILLFHRWLGLLSGLVVLFLGLTGCILAFQKEIEQLTVRAQYVTPESKPYVLPSQLKINAEAALPGKHPHSITYGKPGKAATALFYDVDYFNIVFLNPYSGDVIKVKNMNRDFFRVVITGHFYLWLPPDIGQPIVASATLIFVLMMITGLILWWPKNKAARKQRFSIKWNVRWRRKNYDLHNVLGFYMSWVAIFIAITGLVMGFQWFAKFVYWTSSGGKEQTAFYQPVSQAAHDSTAVDKVYNIMKQMYPDVELLEMHFPDADTLAIEAAANPDAGTYWKTDYRYFDQLTLKEIEVTHAYGKFANTSTADKIARINYDLHVGAVSGLPTKILAFFASLIAASLPVTGFIIWWGRRKKKNTQHVVESFLKI